MLVDYACRSWRISFSMAEKEIIFHADGTDSSTETCKKDVLRLLKDDVERLNKQMENIFMCSYFMKTVLLHLLDNLHSKRNCWLHKGSKLRLRYTDALLLLVKFLGDANIPHYFIRQENLLDHTVYKGKDIKFSIKFFKKIISRNTP